MIIQATAAPRPVAHIRNGGEWDRIELRPLAHAADGDVRVLLVEVGNRSIKEIREKIEVALRMVD